MAVKISKIDNNSFERNFGFSMEKELSKLINEELKIRNMPSDQNYLWSEEDDPQNGKSFDFRKINKIKFGDEKLNILVPRDMVEYFNFSSVEEAHMEADYGLAYLVYKYIKINKIVPGWLYLTGDVLKNDFFEKFIHGLSLPTTTYLSTYRYNNKFSELSLFWCNLGNIFLYYDGNGLYVIFPPEQKNNKNTELEIILGLIKTYKKPKIVRNKIYIVYTSPHGFDKKDFSVKKIKSINIEENYNDGFPEVSKDIITKLNNKKKTGLIILHGEPGTGKTTYLRYLAGKLKRNIIFIPPDMVHNITDPGFISFLMDNSDSILILEDAEVALQKRDQSGSTGAVSNILNLTDGLLSDCLNISILATFNTGTKNIDEALLRKGRLLKAYKFDKLDSVKTEKLMRKLGHHNLAEYTSPMSLAEIYYYGDEVKGNAQAIFEQKKVGFGN
jgi:hypothetical protein